jgi:DNA-binding MarR family transcriptional regulator
MPGNLSFTDSLQVWIEAFMRNSLHSFILYSKESGLSMSQIGALSHIHMSCGGVSDIGENMGISNAAASQMLDRLVQQGLVLRSEDPIDRRAKRLVLTEKGIQVLQESIRHRQIWLDSLAETLTPAEQDQIAAAFTLLVEKSARLEQQKVD